MPHFLESIAIVDQVRENMRIINSPTSEVISHYLKAMFTANEGDPCTKIALSHSAVRAGTCS